MDVCENFCHQGIRDTVFVESKRLAKIKSSGLVNCDTGFLYQEGESKAQQEV